jgi:hypothetical protein
MPIGRRVRLIVSTGLDVFVSVIERLLTVSSSLLPCDALSISRTANAVMSLSAMAYLAASK